MALSIDNSGAALVAPVVSEGGKMKLKILRGTVAAGNPAKPGDIVEVSKAEGRLLINYQKAEEYTEAPKRKARRKKSEE